MYMYVLTEKSESYDHFFVKEFLMSALYQSSVNIRQFLFQKKNSQDCPFMSFRICLNYHLV